MKKAVLIPFLIAFVSCDNKQNYQYIENIKEMGSHNKVVVNKKEYNIRAKNDTLAYIEAYAKFKVSQKIMHELKVGGSMDPKEVISFQLFNSEGKNITAINFNTKEAQQRKADEYAAELDLSYTITH